MVSFSISRPFGQNRNAPRRFGQAPYRKALAAQGFVKASEDKMLEPLFEYLEFCLRQVVADNELGALVDALDGQYIEPGPGGDPIRNPGVLPTGKNMHALDPQSIPTTAARGECKGQGRLKNPIAVQVSHVLTIRQGPSATKRAD